MVLRHDLRDGGLSRAARTHDPLRNQGATLCCASNSGGMGSSLKDREAMRTQTRALNDTRTVRQERPICDRSSASPWNVSQNTRVGCVSYQAEHQGYRLTALAEPVKSGLHAAHLAIEGPGCPTQRGFHALDYFYDPTQALRYAIRWGRIWVDHRLAKVATQRVESSAPAGTAALPLTEQRANRADHHE